MYEEITAQAEKVTEEIIGVSVRFSWSDAQQVRSVETR